MSDQQNDVRTIHCGKRESHPAHDWLAYAGPGVLGGYAVRCPGTCSCGHYRTNGVSR